MYFPRCSEGEVQGQNAILQNDDSVEESKFLR